MLYFAPKDEGHPPKSFFTASRREKSATRHNFALNDHFLALRQNILWKFTDIA